MNPPIVPPNIPNNKPTQTGPPWTCFECGQLATGLRCYTEFLVSPTPKPLDDWGEHIWYLSLLPACRADHHTTRVARLGDAITPLTTYIPGQSAVSAAEQRASEAQAIANVRAALATLATAHGDNPSTDPATSIVYNLLAGALTPDAAVARIQALVRSTVNGEITLEDRNIRTATGRYEE